MELKDEKIVECKIDRGLENLYSINVRSSYTPGWHTIYVYIPDLIAFTEDEFEGFTIKDAVEYCNKKFNNMRRDR